MKKLGIAILAIALMMGFIGCGNPAADTQNSPTHTHEWEWKVTTPATCLTDGLETETCKHDSSHTNGTRPITALGHDMQATANATTEPTCENDGVGESACTRCDHTVAEGVITKLGHSFISYVSNGNATCETDGTETAQCVRFAVCGQTDTKNVVGSALGHSLGSYVSNGNSTYIADGTETAQCVRFALCGHDHTKTEIGSQKAITDIAEFETVLSGLASNTTNTAYTLIINIDNLGIRDASPWYSEFAGVIISTGRYVNLDMSGSTLTSIGDRAFLNCSGLIGITMKNSIISIGLGAFNSCTNLANIIIPDNITTLKQGVFGGCNFANIVIPNSVTTIELEAFYFCNSLTSVTFERADTTIENNNSFPDGASLRAIYPSQGAGTYIRTGSTWAKQTP